MSPFYVQVQYSTGPKTFRFLDLIAKNKFVKEHEEFFDLKEDDVYIPEWNSSKAREHLRVGSS